jgi:hypothetical protein
MPFRTHPELAKLFQELEACTCAACILKDSDIPHLNDLVETFEQLALKAGYLAHATCATCFVYKAVICPISSS